jgi:hypothetical protein
MAIIEGARLGGDALGQHRVPGPVVAPKDRPNGVEALTHVQSFARRDQPSGSERHFLPPYSQCQRARRPSCRQFDERLMELKAIFVSETGAAGSARLEPALNLGEDANTPTGAQISMEEIPLQKIAIRVLGA